MEEAPTLDSWRYLVAASILVVTIGLVFHDRAASPSVLPVVRLEEGTDEQWVDMAVDLRAFAVTRGAAPQSPRSPLLGDYSNSSLQLPIGSPPGEYLAVIENMKNTKLFEARATASIRQYVTTAKVDVDLRSFPPGAYKLASVGKERSVGERIQWRFVEMRRILQVTNSRAEAPPRT